MSLYRTKDCDRIDLIVLNNYGDLVYLNDVISANKVLFDKPLNLVAGLDIELPEFAIRSDTQVKPKERGPLW